MTMEEKDKCKHCGESKWIRNPTGKCDHLYWPDYLTDEAKIANGYRKVWVEVWDSNTDSDGLLSPRSERQ